jgi:hypothetical protein
MALLVLHPIEPILEQDWLSLVLALGLGPDETPDEILVGLRDVAMTTVLNACAKVVGRVDDALGVALELVPKVISDRLGAGGAPW